MLFRPFYELCREVAEAETRNLFLTDENSVRYGYSFIEAFCDELKCDCRRAFLYVHDIERSIQVAVIGYGWASLEHYKRQFPFLTDEEIRGDLMGFNLPPMTPQTGLSNTILELVNVALATDKPYLERIVRHYDMFRAARDKKPQIAHIAPRVGRNSVCPCGSGRKYKKCCMLASAV
jgi:hypothetical protein